MKAIDEAKVKKIVQELKGKQNILGAMLSRQRSDDERASLYEDMTDIDKLIKTLEGLKDVPDDAWTLALGGDDK